MARKKVEQKKFVHKRGQCSSCNEPDQPGYRSRQTEKFVCLDCKAKAYYHNKAKHKKCAKCGRRRHVARRSPDGQPVCGTCYQEKMNIGRCGRCGGIGTISLCLVTPSGRKKLICTDCYHQHFHCEDCAACGQCRPVKRRIEGKQLCQTCYKNGSYKLLFPNLFSAT